MTSHDTRLPDGLELGAMRRDELDVLVDWAAGEGWNPGLADAEAAWSTDPAGFVALRSADGLVGGGCVVSYDGAWGFLGLFIVREGLRGEGLGGLLWDRLIAMSTSRFAALGAPVGLDGVLAMQPYYARNGFAPAYRDLRFEGRPEATGDAAVPVVAGAALTAAELDELVAYDEQHGVGPRRGFMRDWFTRPRVLVARVRDDDGLVAAGALRPCREGWKYGPVLASDPSAAERVVVALAASVPGELVQLDVPEPNEAGCRIAQSLGLVESFACARMYRGAVPSLPVHRIFGVTSFEFG